MEFRLADRPLISLLAFGLMFLSMMFLRTMLSRLRVGFSNWIIYDLLGLFIIVPFVLHHPKEKQSFRQYLADVRLS